jgi:hypothetical protein
MYMTSAFIAAVFNMIKYDHRSLGNVSCNTVSSTHFVNCVYIAFCIVIKCDYFRFAFVTKIIQIGNFF